MRKHPIPPFDQTEPVNGVVVVDGWNPKIRVEHRHLAIEDGIGPSTRHRRFHKATAGFRRLVIIGASGYITFRALTWLDEANIGWIHLDRNGRVLATSVVLGTDYPALRRAQAAGLASRQGLDVLRTLLEMKLEGQANNASRLGGDEVAAGIRDVAGGLAGVTGADEARLIEANAAALYWDAWTDVPVRFPRRQLATVPEHWVTFGMRRSALSKASRNAANPANAILNYLYALLEAETRIGLATAGLDPGVGLLHADQPQRANLALDVMEAVRPTVDRYVLDLLSSTTFTRTDFYETDRGICRVLAPVTHRLAETSPTWASELGPIIDTIVTRLTDLTSRPERIPTPLTEANRSRGRKRRSAQPKVSHRSATVVARCEVCGADVPRERRLCDPCRAAKDDLLRGRALERLRLLRDAGKDPAHGGDAGRLRAENIKRQNALSREWDRQNESLDPTLYDSEIAPRLGGLTVREMMSATGLSKSYCSQIRAGAVVPHQRHWQALVALVSHS